MARAHHNNFDLLHVYNKLVSGGNVKFDQAQENIISILDRLGKDIINKYLQKGIFTFIKSVKKTKSPKGVYIYGEPGRGKSFIMDLFFDNLPVKSKRRIHFHQFMIEMHNFLHQWQQQNARNFKTKTQDPIKDLASYISKNCKILCLDEFHITDITDAMLVGRLFANLFHHNIILVTTSNRVPEDLYKDGLQRDNFLPFIELINNNTNVINLNALCDYRLQFLGQLNSVYFTPLGEEADIFLDNIFKHLTNNARAVPRTLTIKKRKVTLSKCHGDVAFVEFSDLCLTALSTEDYLEIAREFNTMLIANIPKMQKTMRNEAKRFCLLIDQLYEHNVKLICSAESCPNQLYVEGDGSFEFERTASRLYEMQGGEYVSRGHLS